MKTLILSFFAVASLQAAPLPLFDGKSIEGWRIQDAPFWTVKEGVLTGESIATAEGFKKGSILWTTKEFKDFTFETEFRFVSKNLTNERVDSGVFLRNPNDQIQIGISGSLKRDLTGSPYVASKKGYPVEAEGVAAILKEGDWNKMKIVAKGPVYTVEINGKKVLEYTSTTASEKGPLGLQVHPGTVMKVDYRKMMIEELQ